MSEGQTVGSPWEIAFNVSPADPPLDEWIIGTSTLGTDTYYAIED